MAKKSDFALVVQKYPEMILTSENPVTWKGLLRVSPKNSNFVDNCFKVMVKLIVPNYPSLREAEVFFGREVQSFGNAEFQRKVDGLLRSKSSGEFVKKDRTISNPLNFLDSSIKTVLSEIKEALQELPEIDVLWNSSLGCTIKLRSNNVSITLERSKSQHSSWNLVSSDLPQIPNDNLFETIPSLLTAKRRFKDRLDLLEIAWHILEDIDQNCWVMEPVKPKPHHLYRRIHLTPMLSIIVTLNPFQPEELPDIKYLGSKAEVERHQDIFVENFQKWAPEDYFLDNLKMLFGIEEFPQSLEMDMSDNSDSLDAIVGENECQICFAMELENGENTDCVCENAKCQKKFHTECLRKWLQTTATKTLFNYCYGKCPNCDENICCREV